MTTVYDVPADKLIPKVAEKLKTVTEIAPPEWAPFVKTGPHREKPPENQNWWHVRMAAILRKVYVYGPVGSSRLSAAFGGTRDRRDSPNKSVKGSGSISRKGLQQLEKAGLIVNVKGKGRTITPKGRKFLDNTAAEAMKEMLAAPKIAPPLLETRPPAPKAAEPKVPQAPKPPKADESSVPAAIAPAPPKA